MRQNLSPTVACTGLKRSFALTRRDLLQVGAVNLLSANLLHVLAARSGAAPRTPASVRRGSARACIILFQVGGPYQCDTFDPKPSAPEEVRGPFRPIATRVVGLRMTEALPQVAAHADKIAILRAVHHTIRCHNPAIYCSLAGREATDPMAVSNRTNAQRLDHPHYASVVARLRPGIASMPHHVIIPDVVYNGPARSPGLLAGYLGASHDPFILGADPNAPTYRVEGAELPPDVDRDRFAGRRGLLRQMDARQRSLDRGGVVETMDAFYQQAFNMLGSSRARHAFDLGEEPVRVRDRYGRHTMGQGALLARRLVEAGVPFVTVFSHTRVERESWDTHNRHYELSRRSLLPPADQSFSALLEDLAVRGLLDETLVVWMGEFGRTPRMGVNFSNNTNNVGGRDHWCNCYSVVLAGGGVRGGQVVGSSDWIGGYPRERPVHISDLAATIYHALGVDPRAQLYDIQGQLRFICDGNPVQELFAGSF
ncbi:MAG TPA: DUF1501 domain-containing protein [Gemmataceae bacterium]|nr:DUF1501 domain-containing protein [Gemmataceae bacterium]